MERVRTQDAVALPAQLTHQRINLPCIVCIIVALFCCIKDRAAHAGSVSRAFTDALFSPETWIPLGASVASYASGADRKISDWATENTPIFGGITDARTASDNISGLLFISTYTTAAIHHSTQQKYSLSTGLTFDTLAIGVNAYQTDNFKRWTDRKRPLSPESDESFLSGHSSNAHVMGTLSAIHMRHIFRNDPYYSDIASASAYVASGAVAWARVEGGRHYPSDVLAGAALGNFIANFANNLLQSDAHARFGVFQDSDGWKVLTRWEF